MPVEPAPAKYAVIINALQRRIEDGTYPVGALLPSETDLVREFGASRSTVVRALEFLRQQGWLLGQQGVGRIVLDRAAGNQRTLPQRLRALLGADGGRGAGLLSAGIGPAPRRVASALGLSLGASVVFRRRVLAGADGSPYALSTVYARPELVAGTSLAETVPLTEDVVRHLGRRAGVLSDHIIERVSCRMPTQSEAALLRVRLSDCLPTVLVIVHDRAGQPLVAADAVIVAKRHPLETRYALR